MICSESQVFYLYLRSAVDCTLAPSLTTSIHSISKEAKHVIVLVDVGEKPWLAFETVHQIKASRRRLFLHKGEDPIVRRGKCKNLL